MTQASDIQFNDGEAYEQLMGRWSRKVGVRFLDWCQIPPKQVWLDVGCGNGAFTEEILRMTSPHDVRGIDPSSGQIAYAKARPGCERATFQIGDAQMLAFGDATFDVVVMALAISFVPDPLQALREMKRVTKPGGTVATYMWDLPGGGVPLAPFYRVLKSLGEPAPMPPHAETSRIDALENLWREAGLTDIETTSIRIPVSFRNFEEFWDTNTLPVGPQAERIRNLSENMRQSLKQKLKSSLPTARDGSITYEAFANAVKGRVS
jgi:ubiquinone/menaquinone biosynthesis C-methylase UbiE